MINFIFLQLESSAIYEPFMTTSIKNYVDKMSQAGEWGGHLEMFAMVELLNVTIEVHVERMKGN
jgi:hypothetical protein